MLELPFQKPPPVDECERALDAAEDEYAKTRSEGADERISWYERDRVLAYREPVELARRDARRNLKFEIQALALGDELCVVAMTHEVFAEYQFWIDDVSPFANSIVFA